MAKDKVPTLLLAASLAACAAAITVHEGRSPERTSGVLEAAPEHELQADEERLVEIFEKVSPSVVFISNVALRRDLFSLNVEEVPLGAGSGFVWDTEGHVVTNYHVVAGAHAISVTLPDQTSWRAKRVGTAPDKDLAVLEIDAPPEKLAPIPRGRSDDLRVGMTALAIGNPFGLDNTLTKGIVSALGREITALTRRTITDVIQTDAAINPGNSGGPLLDSRGHLIGVNTAILSKTGSSSGIGFAVPVKTVDRVVGQIIEHGRVIQPGFGIIFVRDGIARRAGLRRGVLIQRVLPESAAERAGLRGIRYFRDGSIELGDIIVRVDEHDIEDSDDLLNVLERYQVGDVVEVHVIRDGKARKVRIRLQAVE